MLLAWRGRPFGGFCAQGSALKTQGPRPLPRSLCTCECAKGSALTVDHARRHGPQVLHAMILDALYGSSPKPSLRRHSLLRRLQWTIFYSTRRALPACESCSHHRAFIASGHQVAGEGGQAYGCRTSPLTHFSASVGGTEVGTHSTSRKVVVVGTPGISKRTYSTRVSAAAAAAAATSRKVVVVGTRKVDAMSKRRRTDTEVMLVPASCWIASLVAVCMAQTLIVQR